MIFQRKIKQLFIPKNKLIIFTFHQVSDVFDPQKHSKYIWSQTDFFIRQLEFLKNNYEILPLNQSINKLKNNEIKGTTISITFDDGDKSVEQTIVPILEHLKIPATFFINTAYLDQPKGYWFNYFYHLEHSNLAGEFLNENIWKAFFEMRKTSDPDVYNRNRQLIESFAENSGLMFDFYVSKKFLETLNPKLFSLGLHGHEHQRFSAYSSQWQEFNIQQNIEELKIYNAYVPIFAIPFGTPLDWNGETIRIAKEKKLEIVLANKGYNVKYSNPLMRFSVDSSDIEKFMQEVSPFIRKYYKMNNL